MSEAAIRLIVAVIALIIMSFGLAHAQTVQKIEIYEYGTYTAPPLYDAGVSRQGLPWGVVDHIDLVEPTNTVIAQIGQTFGFRYRVIGTPLGAPVNLKMVVRFPSPGITAPAIAFPFIDDDLIAVHFLGDKGFRIWTFVDRSDLVPGIWTFEIWSGNSKLAEQKFNVVLPPIANRQSPALLASGKVG